MSTSSSARRRQFWRADWFVAVVLVLAVLVVHMATDVFASLERRWYDFGASASDRRPSDRVAIIAIDDRSIANIGPWPWPRDVHAQLIDQLAAARAKTIVETLFLFEPQADRGLPFIRKIKETLGPVPEGAGGQAEQLAKVIAAAEESLDTDARLAASMTDARNVLVPALFTLGVPQEKANPPLPAYVLKSTVAGNAGFLEAASRAQVPIAPIGAAAAGVGHLNVLNDPADGTVRAEPLLVNFDAKAVPSMALLAAASSLDIATRDIKLHPGESVELGKLKIGTDKAGRMLPRFYKGHDGKPAFAIDSFQDVLSGRIPAGKYAGKIVLIGATGAGVGLQSAAPGYPAITPVELVAHSTSSILDEDFIVQPSWGAWVATGALLLVAAYLIAGLPRLSAGLAAGVTAALLLVLLATEFTLLCAGSTWLKLAFPAALLAIGHLGLAAKRWLVSDAGTMRPEATPAEAHRMMALARQGQGSLDEAFDLFRRVPLGDAVMENLYNLALDFERKRQFNKARAVYEHMAGWNKDFKDLQSKLRGAGKLAEPTQGTGSRPAGMLVLDADGAQKPMLGRYQVERELGKGAMGVVYLGKDPKIGRVVAIKTMALSQEFEGEELADARERFFREAETAGRLQHQNIVTIFDAGEEHELAYIAMEFLKGRDLADFCREGALLPVPRVLSIVARVAEALAYAHRQKVVHRDIKPANIMYEFDTDTVKVTDFGIARITDSSKTKTGLVLGTPSFMSPEQIAGKKVDGRSDLYSLGVMLFQMLTGVLPLRGDSMAELMYKIASEEAPDIRIVRREIPERLANIVALALSKRPETRYQDGNQFAADLRSVLAAGNTASFAPVPAASAAYEPTVLGMPAAAPGYDPSQQRPVENPGFAKTDVFRRPAPGAPDGKNDKA